MGTVLRNVRHVIYTTLTLKVYNSSIYKAIHVIGHMEVDIERETSNYPSRSILQPVTGVLSLIGCVLLVIVNSVLLWSGFHFQSFLGSYLAISRALSKIFVPRFNDTDSFEMQLFLFFILMLYLKYKSLMDFAGG
jgi:amino acid permease